jgi:polysaccharide deacetylase family protein (PEP-CTERM system associated)
VTIDTLEATVSRRTTALGAGTLDVALSFDVEEHDQIEAAAELEIAPALKADYARRVGERTRWLLDRLARHDLQATFFIVGQVAQRDPALVRAVLAAGHEVASHGWAHRRILEMTPDQFREDLRLSVDALEQITGEPVVGFRAPTFSLVPRTGWAIDILCEAGLRYDSSIFPVKHDRYGIPSAPRTPFVALGPTRSIVELPPATWQLGAWNLPVAGGGYFRLFPLAVLRAALRQIAHLGRQAATVLYFHPWEFDPDQPRLPLGRLNRIRTYVGIRRNARRLESLLEGDRDGLRFRRAVDVVRSLDRAELPRFDVSRAAPLFVAPVSRLVPLRARPHIVAEVVP